jgi:hypothetical protein
MHDGTATPAAEEEQSHMHDHDAEHAMAHDMPARMPADAVALAHTALALSVLDAVDFHGMDVTINEQGVLAPEYAARVAQARALVAAVPWPDEAAPLAANLEPALAALKEALAAGDVAAAQIPATEAHDLHHELDHTATHWLHQHGPMVDAAVDPFAVAAATYALAALDPAQAAQSLAAGAAGYEESRAAYGAYRLVGAVQWPEPLRATADALLPVLGEMVEALELGDTATAQQSAPEFGRGAAALIEQADGWLAEQETAAPTGDALQTLLAQGLLALEESPAGSAADALRAAAGE